MTVERQSPALAYIWEDSSLFVMARMLGHGGTAVTQASLSAITYAVYDITDSYAAGGTGTLTINSTVFDTLQDDDPRWDVDDTGYNFGATIPASCFPTGDRAYFVKITFDPASGDNFTLNVRVETSDLPGQ